MPWRRIPATIASRQVRASRGHGARTASESPVKTRMLKKWRAVRKVSGSARVDTTPATMNPVAQMRTKRPERSWITYPGPRGSVPRHLRADRAIEVLHPAVVVAVDGAVHLVQLIAALVDDAVAPGAVGDVHHGGVLAQHERALELPGTRVDVFLVMVSLLGLLAMSRAND